MSGRSARGPLAARAPMRIHLRKQRSKKFIYNDGKPTNQTRRISYYRMSKRNQDVLWRVFELLELAGTVALGHV
jgi:hypothetical protein